MRELDSSRLKFSTLIGKGQFGMVFKGLFVDERNIQMPVAIKVAPKAKRDSSLSEAYLLSQLYHDHIVPLVGIVSKVQRVLLVLPFCENGSLDQSYKRKGFTTEHVVDMSSQIIKALAYLHGKGIVHRDIAARNVLVTSDMRYILSDFGMAQIFDTSQPGTALSEQNPVRDEVLPMRWLAPESITSWSFSPASDVYTFAVLLWECYSGMAQPYQGKTLATSVELIKAGKMLSRPEACSPKFYRDCMAPCWQFAVSSRPSAEELCSIIDSYCQSMPATPQCPGLWQSPDSIAEHIEYRNGSQMAKSDSQHLSASYHGVTSFSKSKASANTAEQAGQPSQVTKAADYVGVGQLIDLDRIDAPSTASLSPETPGYVGVKSLNTGSSGYHSFTIV